MLGDLYTKQGKYDKAEECFRQVLSVKEWSGPLWPAALFGAGDVARMRGKLDQACAYYERIYLMYASYRTWSAKAYVSRADTLTRMQEYNKAVETLEAMLAVPELAALPEAKDAQERLAALKRKLQ